jgi:hypothetical protein
VLLIGVNSLTASQPNLESVTVVKYQTEVNKYFLIALSPDTITCPISGTEPIKRLRDYYAEDASHNRQALLTQAALEAISKQLGGIYAEVDFDRPAVLATMGLLGPVSCMGQTQSGDELQHGFDALPAGEAKKRLHFQGNLLQCLFMAAKGQYWDFPKLMNQLGRRFYPTRDRATVTFEAAPPLADSDVTVNYVPLNPFVTATPQP